MTEHNTALSISMAKALIDALQRDVPGWQRAFIRFDAGDTRYGSTGSYVTAERVFIFDPSMFRPVLNEVNALAFELWQNLLRDGRRFCVLLLSVNSDFDWKIDFEWFDPQKWKITKVDGGSGIPVGIE